MLRTIEQDGLLVHVRRMGDRLEAGLRGLASPLVAGVRGSGLWWGLVLHAPLAGPVEAAARERGLLVNAVKADVLRLAPALTVDRASIEQAVGILADALADVDGADREPESARPERHDRTAALPAR